jgi:nitroimidazol reductase NimA-like FMN-containing flavoprotein (pyridoxamine 5'-phosphate oxidase superfamily)
VTTATPVLPDEAARVLDAALVAELTVCKRSSVVTYPLIPLRDGALIYMTSSVLFSRKLEHIKANPRVAVSVTDPSATPLDDFVRVTVQGDARVIEDDPHAGWLHVLPLWERKEPVIRRFLRQRFGLPLFFERAVIEVTPRRVFVWSEGGWIERHELGGG